jgi:hypothetical protein
MNGAELIDKLIATADGDIALVHEAIFACAKNPDGTGGNLNEIITYIITASLRREHSAAAASDREG